MLAVLLWTFPLGAQTIRYSVIKLPVPRAYKAIDGHALNNKGQVTGEDYFGESQAFLYSVGPDGKRVMTFLPTSGGKVSEGTAINDRGQIAGEARTGNEPVHAFLYTDGVMKDISATGGLSSFVGGMNNSGQVTGWTTFRDWPHAFL